jgi:hypothetical protein
MKLTYLVALAPLLLSGCASTGTVSSAAVSMVPRCNGPNFSEVDAKGRPRFDEAGMARDAELELRANGVRGAHNTRWWNGCLQTFVPIDGHDVMKFYDPDSFREVATN